MFTYRKTTKAEDEKFENKCGITLHNTMRCPRRITRFVNGQFLCEGHFQIKLAEARNKADQLVDLDENSELLTGKSEPLEK